MHFIKANYPLYIGLVLASLLIVVAVFGPTLARHDPLEPAPITFDGDTLLMPPFQPLQVVGYPLGTDEVGRDVLSRILWAVRPTLVLCFTIVGMRVAIGVLFGLIAGWVRGATERTIDTLISASVSIPSLVFALAAVLLLGIDRGLLPFVIALTLTGWADTAALVKNQAVTIRQAPYIEGARAIGVRAVGLVWRHVLPQMWPIVPMLLAFESAAVILLLAELGFLGIFIGGGFLYETDAGMVLTSGYPELGQLLATFWAKLYRAPWEPVLVGSTVFLAIVGFNCLGEGLRRRMDVTRPRHVLKWVWWRKAKESLVQHQT
jgi:ABC-type dipeptide/oligopeptide/nickel transport system permease subunit